MDKKQKIIVTLIIAVAIIFVPVYFYVLADDSDENKIEVVNTSINKVIDGTLPFDSESGNGNDTSDNNGVVRTFDSVTYTLKYDLVAKEGETIDTSNTEREVVVDVLIPTNVTAKVSTSSGSDVRYLVGESTSCDNSEGNIVFDGGNKKYRYAEFIIEQGVGDNKTINILIDEIYSSNDTELNPIFIVKEKTDLNKKAMIDLTCAEKQGSFDSVKDEFNIISACNNEMGESTSCDVTITGKENYSTKLFSSTSGKIDGTSTNQTIYPVGVLITLNDQIINGDENKGIKGLLIPNNASISFSDVNNIGVTLSDYKTYTSYTNQNPQLFKINFDDSNEFEELSNGTVTGENNTMNISNIKHIKREASGYYYISSNVFYVTYERPSYDYQDKNIVISSNKGGQVNFTNSYNFTLGDYNSKVELKNTLDSVSEPYGIANFNYNQDFYIKESFSYSGTGDGITNLNNYLKIDNDAVDIIANDSNTYATYESNNGTSINEIKFGYGEWNSNFFELTYADDCPTSFEELTREQLMNLYGGPCITEKANAIKWVDINSEIDTLSDDYKQRGPILVQTVLTGDEIKNNLILTGTEASITLKAKIKSNYLLNNNTYQIVTSAYAYANGNKTTLGKSSESNSLNGEVIIKDRDNFRKTVISSDGIITNSNICLTESCPISGNTILVSGVKVAKPNIKYYRNGKETSNFYYYPIEMRISSSAIKNDSDTVYDKADIYVDLPSYMEYIDYDNSSTAKSPVDVADIIIGDKSYKRYHYVFNRNEVTDGEVNDLKVFSNISMDTENGVMPTIYVTSDYTIAKEVSLANNEKTTVTMSSIMPSSYRSISDTSITLYNGSNVTTQGNTAQSNIEKNGSYTYVMKAYNNSRNNGNSLSYPNASLYYVVPYKGDSSYSDLSSNYKASGFKIKINSTIPSGYKVYYTESLPSNIINEEINNTNSITWKEWTNLAEEKSNITGIKITKTDNYEPDTYFISKDGISITVTPINSEEGDLYYNVFYIITSKPSNYECGENDTSCSTSDSKKLYYSSSRTLTGVYNRKISGFIFEDYNEDGLFTIDESRLENIPVSLYKIDGDITNADSFNPATFVSENDTLIAETTTGSNGEYSFRGLSKGNYYVKYTYDDEKYTPTSINVVDPNISGSGAVNSKASALVNTDIAISNIITFSSKTTEFNDINLGLKIKKEFAVDIKKFITNVQIISDDKVENFDYNNATTVTLNVVNPKNSKLRVTYSFYVENTKYYPGYVGMIVDAIPEGMTFNPNLVENKDWILVDNYVYYNGLSGAILLPNQKIPFSLVLEADLETGGTYINSVSVRDLVLMGDELPSYDFNSLNLFNEGGE